MGGIGIMSAFASTVLPINWQAVGFSGGAAIFAVACFGALWDAINTFREHRKKPRLKLEPNYLIIFGLAVALIGVAWQQMRGPQPLQWDQGQVVPAASAAQPQIQPSRYYSPKEKERMGDLLATMRQLLNREGLTAARETRNAGRLEPTVLKDRIRENTDRLAAAKKQTDSLFDGIWRNMIMNHEDSDIAPELEKLIGPVQNLQDFQKEIDARIAAFDAVTSAYDSLQRDDRVRIIDAMNSGDALGIASGKFENWIRESTTHIDTLNQQMAR